LTEKPQPYLQSAKAQEESFLISINEEAYDILVREHERKERDDFLKFICNNIPGLATSYSPN
jgi:hypothetical protein